MKIPEVVFIPMSDELKEAMAQQDWCECTDYDAHYVPDTPEMKHHWDCNHCGKLTQIG